MKLELTLADCDAPENTEYIFRRVTFPMTVPICAAYQPHSPAPIRRSQLRVACPLAINSSIRHFFPSSSGPLMCT